VLKNGGLLTSFNPETGSVEKAGRMAGAFGNYMASPVAAEGKIYLAGEEGKVTVLKAGAQWEVLQTNDLDEACYATPALAGGSIYLRTNNALYRFATKTVACQPVRPGQTGSDLPADAELALRHEASRGRIFTWLDRHLRQVK
jgi:hypothetical protein